MGVSCLAMVIVGCRVPVSAVRKSETVRGCEHEETGAKYCSECGKQTWRIEKESEWAPAERFVDLGLRVSWSTDDQFMYVGAVGTDPYKDDEYAHRIDVGENATMAELKEKAKAALEPLGAWRESAFGIWCVLNVDY